MAKGNLRENILEQAAKDFAESEDLEQIEEFLQDVVNDFENKLESIVNSLNEIDGLGSIGKLETAFENLVELKDELF